ncbi:MAG: pantoate--beta-alanine ligase [Pseudomonadota bacterium]
MAVLLKTRKSLKDWTTELRMRGTRVALVPTMGALHDGHLSLVRRGQEVADRTVVSIFVNPAQFAPSEDFDRYPRTLEKDLDKLAAIATDAVFTPTSDDIYPPGFATTIVPTGPAVAGLEDISRPDHFAGVATVVAKLLIQCAPDVAVFGEKDYQQLSVVRRMTRDLDLPVEIVGAETVREPDGLAMSSRNRYLSDDERQRAPVLFQALMDCAEAVRSGADVDGAIATSGQRIEEVGFEIDYLALRDAETLLSPTDMSRPLRILVAAQLGATRLIDNVAV